METDPFDPVGPGLLHTSGPVDVHRLALPGGGGTAFFSPPRALKRLSREGKEVIGSLQQISAQIHYLQGHLEEHVHDARDLGASWDLIGWSVGTTGEGARQRWGVSRDDS